MFNDLSLTKKIALGFTIITLTTVSVVGVSIWKIRSNMTKVDRLVKLRAPTIQASMGMLNGINHSLAALRGWIILGKNKFKTEREIAWKNEIMLNFEQMQKFSLKWTDPNNLTHLKTVKNNLELFNKYQTEIENIAQSTDNTPALKLLLTEAAPQASILVEQITKMIDIEATLEATKERKDLLGMMADVRGTTGVGLANIRAFLLTGDNKFKENFDKLWSKNSRRFKLLLSKASILNQNQKTALISFINARKIFAPLTDKMFQLRGATDWNKANFWLGTKAAPTGFKIKEALDAMVKSQKNLMKADMDDVQKMTNQLIMFEWILLFICIFVSISAGTLITRSIVTRLRKVAENLNHAANEAASASHMVADSSQTLSRVCNEQASSIEETSSSLEEITSMVQKNVDNAESSKKNADNVHEISAQGNQEITNLSESMNEILESNQSIQNLVKVIGEIGEKTEVIDEIVFQTKLLSFNASVEAERAGEHGRGFAVVAQEVGSLAQMSGKAALEIKSIVKESINSAEKITLENKQKVELGAKQVASTAKLLREIEKNSDLNSEQANQIVTASKEQSAGINQINSAIALLDKSTQQNAATSEETASSSEELNGQASSLRESVKELVFIITGNNDNPIEENQPSITPKKTYTLPVIQNKASSKLHTNPSAIGTQATLNHESKPLIKEGNGHDDAWEQL
ncbi:hypothetical protein BVY03_00530 [bacterium K02(2017)]|nr:hypothetical protein BVY03_00530 [bacterium K02(2017)]